MQIYVDGMEMYIWEKRVIYGHLTQDHWVHYKLATNERNLVQRELRVTKIDNFVPVWDQRKKLNVVFEMPANYTIVYLDLDWEVDLDLADIYILIYWLGGVECQFKQA